jgi:O-antigen ligase
MNSYTSTPENRLLPSSIVVFALACILAGMAFVAYTWVVLTAMAVGVALFAIRWVVRARLPLWQALIAISLAGFIILNYGFENLVIGRIAGVPLLIGELIMLAGLALAIRKQGISQLRKVMRDPIVLCLVLLLALSVAHLIVDIPRFGLYALRDASLYFEAVFLAAGYLWASEKGGVRRFVQCLIVIFTLNLLYSFTLPLSESLQAISPTTGVFQPIALLGQYQHVGMYLVAGALFCAWLTDFTMGWPRWTLWTMAAAQLCGLAVQQNRSMYVGILVILVLLLLLGERHKLRRSFRALGGGVVAMIVLLLIISLSGVSVHGRAGDINGDFLRQYALSIFSLDNSNSRLAQDEDRIDWLHQVWDSTTSSPTTLLIGQGFGQPLIDFETEAGVSVRQPHNAAMGVFGRLGLSGLAIWLLFQLLLVKRFLRALKAEQNREAHDLILWLLVFYVLAFVLSMVQPALEFSHYAVPLYFIVGFGLKMTDMTLEKSPVGIVSRAMSRRA